MPADVDAGWLVTWHAQLIAPNDAAKLRTWIPGVRPAERRALEERLRREPVTRRVDATAVWSALEAGVRKLGRDAVAERKRHDRTVPAGGLRERYRRGLARRRHQAGDLLRSAEAVPRAAARETSSAPSRSGCR